MPRLTALASAAPSGDCAARGWRQAGAYRVVDVRPSLVFVDALLQKRLSLLQAEDHLLVLLHARLAGVHVRFELVRLLDQRLQPALDVARRARVRVLAAILHLGLLHMDLSIPHA